MLILNAGSSSLKFSLMDRDGLGVRAGGSVDWAGTRAELTLEAGNAAPRKETVSWTRPDEAVRGVVKALREIPGERIDAVAHRVVHGGARFTAPARITPEVRRALAELSELAPLHNPPSLEVIDTALAELPEVPHVAVFDTSFHRTLPPEAYTYPIPGDWTGRWALRRFGFHGFSHEYAAGRAAELMGRTPEGLRLVIAHLGHGASVTAVAGGRSVDTSMGFTPLEGLMMATRSGSVDPGLLLHLQLRLGVSASELEEALNRKSGLLGVFGSDDMREVLAAGGGGDPKARLALAIFAHRARQAIGAMAVTLAGVDALVFTGGIGEQSAEVRGEICRGLACLGLELDPDHNASERPEPDADVATPSSPGRIFVVAAREDRIIARDALACLAGGSPDRSA